MKRTASASAGRSPMYRSRGSVTAYMLVLLAALLTITSSLVHHVRRYAYYNGDLEEFRTVNRVEVLTINRIKKAFENYEEEDESFVFEGVEVSIRYEDLTAYITISSENILRERMLEYNDISQIVSYYH